MLEYVNVAIAVVLGFIAFVTMIVIWVKIFQYEGTFYGVASVIFIPLAYIIAIFKPSTYGSLLTINFLSILVLYSFY